MQDIDFLIKQLDSGDQQKIDSATNQLISLGSDLNVLDKLVVNLKSSKSVFVRKNIAYVLGEIKDSSTVQALISAVSDENSIVREQAVSSLGKVGDPSATDALVLALKYDAQYDVREIAAWALGLLGNDKAILPLIDALGDEEIEVRDNAIEALIRISKSHQSHLIEALNRDNEHIQCGVIEILGTLSITSHKSMLIELLSHKNDRVRTCAIQGLRQFKSIELGPYFINCLGDKYYLVRAHAALALSEIGDTQAIEELKTFLDDPHEVVRASVRQALHTLSKL